MFALLRATEIRTKLKFAQSYLFVQSELLVLEPSSSETRHITLRVDPVPHTSAHGGYNQVADIIDLTPISSCASYVQVEQIIKEDDSGYRRHKTPARRRTFGKSVSQGGKRQLPRRRCVSPKQSSGRLEPGVRVISFIFSNVGKHCRI